ncbi:MAG: NAD(P)-dependent glycerol-3-phosphate dehydrogenase [Methylococcaceae bacterium]|nr:NAD(P)-dependent glycerol-3-phosphate dehydrogenase [Methylococcaceae bacterium]MCI0668670.1 NAD(P)-dependent glycerol-3-phosphate dehydrogenase [Methylococcaceae bacterium]MCI0734445.1 NAD(P)-dependent glycerol-3-phosphate dehydrogenase [Methylococcaceae bacterium]
MAILIARNGHRTMLWGRSKTHMEKLAGERCNTRYLPDIRLPDNLEYGSDLPQSVRNRDIVLVAVPSHGFRATLMQCEPFLDPGTRIAWATKGLDPESGGLLHETACQIFPGHRPIAVVSGPTFAKEVARNLPTAMTIASQDSGFASDLSEILHNQRLRVYTSDDIIGVQLGGAVKNVLAIATGAADGLGFGANSRAAIVTRGLAELMRLGLALGAKQETLMGLAGLGDIVLTCTDNQSRNRRLGIGLGQGRPLDQVIREIGQEVEGISAAREIHQLAARQHIEMPISEQVYKVLYEKIAPETAVRNLLVREQKKEQIQ